jgi:hypothetical protein
MIMKARKIFVVLLVLALSATQGWTVDVSSSLFWPRNGYLSYPVAPLSFRNIGVSFGDYLGVSGSLSLYSIRGLGLRDADNKVIDTDDPVVGPMHSLVLPFFLQVTLPVKKTEITLKGGVFGFFNFGMNLMLGNLDRYILDTDPAGPVAATSDLSDYGGRLGFGYVFGGDVTWYFTDNVGLVLGALYYLGKTKMNFEGNYDSDVALNVPLPSEIREARLDFSGLELILGVSYKMNKRKGGPEPVIRQVSLP